MNTILNYLNGLKPDPTGETWTTISRMMADLDLSAEETYNKVMNAQKEGLVHIMKSLEPVSISLTVVGITRKGRYRLKGLRPAQMTSPYLRRDPYNLRVGPI